MVTSDWLRRLTDPKHLDAGPSQSIPIRRSLGDILETQTSPPIAAYVAAHKRVALARPPACRADRERPQRLEHARDDHLIPEALDVLRDQFPAMLLSSSKASDNLGILEGRTVDGGLFHGADVI